MGIGAKLQQAIDNNKTNVNEVARRANVNPSVLYSIIRRDSKSVDINILIVIANILGVPVEYFGDNYVGCLANEKQLIKSEKELLNDFRKLNPVGQEKAAESVHDLTEIPRYRADSNNEETPLPKETAASSA